MDCYCASKDLYRGDYTSPDATFSIEGKEVLKKRVINQDIISNSHPYQNIEKKIIETAEIWTPSQIDKISWDEITFNPLWFHQKYLSKNIPCIITDVLEGDDIFQRWAEPQYLCECLQGQKHSMSLTPNGFADSICGQYFIQPHEQKVSLDKFLNHEQTFPGAVPYIQHQNGNLTHQFSTLNCQISQQIVKSVSQYFFKGKEADAENLWLGYDQSVSSLHKDPYQNFYLSLVGEKHFTLMPPHSILFLEEQEYKAARWKYLGGDKNHIFDCIPSQTKNKWICVNPDLDKDLERFNRLKQAQSYHVQIKKEEMLYLPSLWYHQVSQFKGKDPYVLAVNYWFDMQFTQNYSLYQTCRSLRGLL